MNKGRCPNCFYFFDSDTNLEDEAIAPTEGDISICLNCGTILMFDKDLKRVEMPKYKFERLDAAIKSEIFKALLARTHIVSSDLREKS